MYGSTLLGGRKEGYVIIRRCGKVVLKYAPSMEHWYSDLAKHGGAVS